MVDKEIIAWLRPLHGAYNIIVMLLFLYQASLGLKIRSSRRSGRLNPGAVRRHRKTGPVLVMLAGAGYIGGALLGYLDNGRLLKYPLHFVNGTTIVVLIIATYIISRGITLKGVRLRTIHLTLGLLILCLYALQAFLGTGILF